MVAVFEECADTTCNVLSDVYNEGMETAISTITEIRKALDACTTVYVYSVLHDGNSENPWSGYVKTTKTEIRSLLSGWDRDDTIGAIIDNDTLYLG